MPLVGVGVCVLVTVLVIDGNADGVGWSETLVTVLVGVGVRVLAGVLVMDGNVVGEDVGDDGRADKVGARKDVASALI